MAKRYARDFRLHARAKVLSCAWVNDEATKRACDSGDDAYRVFRRMLDSGRSPSDWAQWLAEARAEPDRLGRLASGGTRASP
jgi:toxin YhaV